MAERKRFYARVEVVEGDGGLVVALDGRAIKTPVGAPLSLAGRALAEAIAAEWDAQIDTIRPHTMQLTQMACTAIDRVATRRSEVAGEMLRHAGTDLVCYRALHPADLAARQASLWQPILDRVEAVTGAGFTVTQGVMPIEQDKATMEALAAWLDARDSFELSALFIAAAALGSLVLAIALYEGHQSAEEVFAASQLDETYQIEEWGEDAEAMKRRETLRADIVAAHNFLTLLRQGREKV